MSNKKYNVVCYMRIDPEEETQEPMTLDEAESEKEHCELMQPENIYRIEEIDNE